MFLFLFFFGIWHLKNPFRKSSGKPVQLLLLFLEKTSTTYTVTTSLVFVVLLMLLIWAHTTCWYRFPFTLTSYATEIANGKPTVERKYNENFDIKKFLECSVLFPRCGRLLQVVIVYPNLKKNRVLRIPPKYTICYNRKESFENTLICSTTTSSVNTRGLCLYKVYKSI